MYSEATDFPFESLLSAITRVYDRESPRLFGNIPETHKEIYEEVTCVLFAAKISDATHTIKRNRKRNPNYRPRTTLNEDLSHFLNEAAEEAEDNLPVSVIGRYKVTTS